MKTTDELEVPAGATAFQLINLPERWLGKLQWRTFFTSVADVVYGAVADYARARCESVPTLPPYSAAHSANEDGTVVESGTLNQDR